MAKIERAQVISCIPSTRGVQVIVEGMDEEEFDDEEDFDEELDEQDLDEEE